MKIKRKKKPSRKFLIRKADVLWGAIIHRTAFCEAQELGKCSGALQAAHVIPRSLSAALRHDVENGIILCVLHHYDLDKRRKFEMVRWFDQKYPGRFDRLNEKRRTAIKPDYQKIIEELENYDE